MPLPDGFEWSVPGLHLDDWCVRRTNAALMLCGRAVDGANRQDGFVPVIQPDEPPAGAHARCLELLADWHGMCPMCGGDIALEAGRVAPHGVWVRTRDGVERSETPCPGAGQVPEAAS
ncbi:hypothetical protein FHR83_006657 [Actinoplanes campanulatus]|uniref:Uncharacterized protein n=1 Tax=Actinoplanes campanulatus TaxID=113559 RepID=A0A7W5FHT1_9ACTN|nr:hypothetical protein [Actinoplanes campanulatus]MBB3098951.1 hypothetical protein [Actinoplanes campanulatus]GGN39712.1 hypothetical protein GCM10010109_67990 [Actinoplanes campanulatus]